MESKKINLRDLYPNPIGGENYCTVSVEIMKAVNTYNRNEDKYRKRNLRHEDLFGYKDSTSDIHISDLNCDPIFEEMIKIDSYERVNDFFTTLTETQIRRVTMRMNGIILEEIARIERVNVNAVRSTFDCVKKKLEKNKSFF